MAEHREHLALMSSLIFATQALGEGAFGKVLLAQRRDTGEYVAVKLEAGHIKAKQLAIEASVIKALSGRRNLPTFISFGPWKDGLALVMPRLGPSMETLRQMASRHRLSVTTVAWVAVEALQAIYQLHKAGLMHRDIKPDNMLINPPGQPRGLFLIDFGMAKQFVDDRGAHIPWINGKSLLGTPRFASPWTHQGQQQSRRDDMVCLAYSLLYLVNGSLPWQGMPPAHRRADEHDANTGILREKLRCTAEILGKDLPHPFRDFLSASLHLEFEEKPEYNRWIRRFARLLPDRFVLDWEPDHVLPLTAAGAGTGAGAGRRSSRRREIRVGAADT